MRTVLLELLVLLVLIIANGLLAMSEAAILAARRARLHQRAEEGDPGAKAALALAGDPNLFLSTVQIGITLVGILAGAFGGATLAEQLAAWMHSVPWLAGHAEALGLGLVVLGITFASLILGELVPKRLALNDPERVAAAVAGPMRVLSVAAAPAVRILGASTNLVLRLLRARPHPLPSVTEEEIRVMIDQGTQAGLFAEAEQDMVDRVFRLGDRRVSALMTPRPDIDWLDLDDPPEAVRRHMAESPYSRLPAAHGSLDQVAGVVHVKDVLKQYLEGCAPDLRAVVAHPVFVPETMRALKLMEVFKESGTHFALVIDEYGGIQGLVTFTDVLEAIVGDIPARGESQEASVIEREDGSWLVDGMMPIDEFADRFGLGELAGPERGDYQTVGGFVILHIGHIPVSGQHFRREGLRFEILDMDGKRVDKVLVSREEPGAGEPPPRS